MNPDAHRIPAQTFAALAGGGGGAKAARRLVAIQYSKHLLLLRSVVTLAAKVRHDEAETVRRAYGQLAEVQERDPAAVAEVIQHPAVGAWARETAMALSSPETAASAVPGQMSAVAAAAAIRAGVPHVAEIPMADGSIMLPSLGRARASAGRVRVNGDGIEVDGVTLPADLSADTGGWQGLQVLTAESDGKRIRLLVDDLDPYRAPGADNVGERLTTEESSRWQSAVDEGWDLLVRDHALVAEELAAMIRVLTPLRKSSDDHVSSTARHAFGAIMLSTPPDAHWFALTMTHELQHAKLCALLDVMPMTHNDDGRRFYAPWREDPRPAAGLLQGAYAFLGVARFWRRQSEIAERESALAEFARWSGGVRRVVDTLLTSGTLTSPGQLFVSGIDQTLRGWEAEPLPGTVLAQARRASEEHEERWRRRNGEIAVSLG